MVDVTVLDSEGGRIQHSSADLTAARLVHLVAVVGGEHGLEAGPPVAQSSRNERLDLFVAKKLELQQPWRSLLAVELCPQLRNVATPSMTVHKSGDDQMTCCWS
uniref:Uncharacterized protein n=1 Tax=Leersia perrieri TaxID=77586 RepID=A0A0D9X7R8_9ORYZ